MSHKYSYTTTYYRFLFAWLLLFLIIFVAIIPVISSYQRFKEADKFYQQVEAFSYGGIFDPFEVDREEQIKNQQYNRLRFAVVYKGLEAAIVVIIALVKLTSFNRFRWKYAKEIEISRANKLYRCVYDLANDMHIATDRIRLWFDNSREIAPSCTTRWGKVHIICPSGFINLFTSDHASAKAMLAHELGHVLQKDSSLWRVVGAARYCVVFLIGLRVLEIAIFILGMLFFTTSNSRNQYGDPWILSVILYAIYIAIQVGACKFITYSKKRSELGADVLASNIVTPSVVIDALKKYLSNRVSKEFFFPSHPTLSERINNIKTYFARYDDANPQAAESYADRNYLSWSLRQLYLIYFRPSQFQREVEGTKEDQPKLTQSERYVYVLKMLPWIILLAHINNLIIGTLWDIIGVEYKWNWSWVAVEFGIVGGLCFGLWFASESDVVVSVGSGIAYGSLAGTLFCFIELFHGMHDFMAATGGIIFGSGFAVASDHIDESKQGLGESITVGLVMGIYFGAIFGLVTAIMHGLGWLVGAWDFKSVIKAVWESFLAGGITISLVFTFIHFRLLNYPVELFISFLAYLKAKVSKQGVIRAWQLHPISWNEVSRLPLPFARTLLMMLAAQDREEGLRQIAFIKSERRFHARVASRVLEAIKLNDLQADMIKEIAKAPHSDGSSHPDIT